MSMLTTESNHCQIERAQPLPLAGCEAWRATASEPAQWYVLYLCSRHEKQVARHLAEKNCEHFLPLYESVRRWKNRHVRLQMPLFPGYLFVHIALHERIRVLQIPGVVGFVGDQGRGTPLCGDEIESLRSCPSPKVRPHPYLEVGRRVRVTQGPMAGAEGILVRNKGSMRVVISLELIRQSMSVEVDAAEIEPVKITTLPMRVTTAPGSKRN